MIVEPVDPRDVTWEVDRPVYRIHLWQQATAPSGAEQDRGYSCDERRIHGADVGEVLRWASETATADQHFTLYVEHVHDGRTGLIRLAGTDPTRSR